MALSQRDKEDYRSQKGLDPDTLKPHPTDQGGKKLREWEKQNKAKQGNK